MVDQPPFTEDVIYGGRLRVKQPAEGYRVNVDTILLGASAPAGAKSVAEAGCGVGAALMIAALNGPVGTQYTGVERVSAAAALAAFNVKENGLEERVRIVEGDALSPRGGVFEAVMFNPPYAYPGEGRPPAPERMAAHVADRPVGDWIKVWSNQLASGGALTLIHRADRLPEILEALEGRLGGTAIFPVRPRAGAEAGRILVRSRKGSRAPLRLLAGLDLHPADGAAKYTPEAEAILRGQAPLRLD